MDTGKCTIPYVADVIFLLGSNSSRDIGIGYTSRLGEGILIGQTNRKEQELEQFPLEDSMGLTR